MGYANIYNAMVAPLDGYSVAGALWYQGENNANQGNSVAAYRAKLSALMGSWRHLFGQNLPFLVIQLSSFDPKLDVARENGWAQVREAQREAVRADRHAALVVTVDVGERLDIHPPLKLPVAERAFTAARHLIYGEAVAPSGPEAMAAIRHNHTLHVTVENATGKLVARTWGRPGPFELCRSDGAGPDCRFVDAQLDAGAIRIDEPTGFHADQVRYCWGGAPQCNVMDTTQLPLGPFELPISDAGHE
jgi:sialate O-acetylesterase